MKYTIHHDVSELIDEGLLKEALDHLKKFLQRRKKLKPYLHEVNALSGELKDWTKHKGLGMEAPMTTKNRIRYRTLEIANEVQDILDGRMNVPEKETPSEPETSVHPPPTDPNGKSGSTWIILIGLLIVAGIWYAVSGGGGTDDDRPGPSPPDPVVYNANLNIPPARQQQLARLLGNSVWDTPRNGGFGRVRFNDTGTRAQYNGGTLEIGNYIGGNFLGTWSRGSDLGGSIRFVLPEMDRIGDALFVHVNYYPETEFHRPQQRWVAWR